MFSVTMYLRPNLFLSTPSARRATSDLLRQEERRGRFLSTPSARRATLKTSFPVHIVVFLSTPSARRATACRGRHQPDAGYFYPRPPRGGRRMTRLSPSIRKTISIHALREEGDSKNRDKSLCFCFSIHGFAQNEKRLKILLKPKRPFLCKKPQGIWCEAPGGSLLASGSHRLRGSGCLPAQRRDVRRCAPPLTYSSAPADRTADCPAEGRSGRSIRP